MGVVFVCSVYLKYNCVLGSFRTALHWAVKKNHLDVVKFLLEKGASVEIKNNDGKTAANLSTDPLIRSLLGALSLG